MGEVYRADDLRLGQQVALKLLPESLRQDPARLAQFHNEVRMARQVSHPNVCRVYDIGESEGFLYLSMEYVDGEDLASSLRRIGRFPEDKAIAIARQLCAGVAAAHQRGIVHRDLKPANVMLDGTGAGPRDGLRPCRGRSGREHSRGDARIHGARAASRPGGHHAKRHLRAGARDLRALHRAARVQRHVDRRARQPARDRDDHAPLGGHRRPQPGDRTRDSPVPRIRSCEAPGNRAGCLRSPAGWRPAGGVARRGRDAVSRARRGGGRGSRVEPPRRVDTLRLDHRRDDRVLRDVDSHQSARRHAAHLHAGCAGAESSRRDPSNRLPGTPCRRGVRVRVERGADEARDSRPTSRRRSGGPCCRSARRRWGSGTVKAAIR